MVFKKNANFLMLIITLNLTIDSCVKFMYTKKDKFTTKIAYVQDKKK